MKKFSKIFIAVLCLMVLVSCIAPAFAATAPYKSYTYSMSGTPMLSPDAYVPERIITNYDIGITELKSAKDLFFDAEGNLYISDTGNNRVIVCDDNFKVQFEIANFTNEHGVPDSLNSPQGLFVNEDYIYVCDTNNSRIVCFDHVGNFVKIIYSPKADVMGEDTIFHPVAMAVDAAGGMYIVSDQTYSGVFYLDKDGNFLSFIGAQKADVPLATRIRRLIFPDVTSIEYVTATYNNCSIDEDGFLYVTTNDIDKETLANAIASGNEGYAPVKRLNSKGDDIMKRTGFFIPAGEVAIGSGVLTGSTASANPSNIIDVALGENGMWSIIDKDRCRLYTYDADGNLLFAFGDMGAQLGNLSQPTAIAYRGSSLYVLDATLNSITVYKRSPYGDIIAQALKHTEDREYDKALQDWEDIRKVNNNFDSAYIGIGTNLYRQGEDVEGAYEESLMYFKSARDTTSYSNSFKAIRKDWVEKYVFVVILVIVVICVVISKFFGYVGKKNKEGVTKLGKRTLWEEFLFGFYLIMHPFDGYWDLKHEKRGSVRGALLIDVLVVLSFIYYTVGRAYLFNPSQGHVSLIYSILTVAVPLLLWCVANWCLTTLFDGEGNFKDIFVSSSYALFPLLLFVVPVTLCTNIASLDESKLISLGLTISFVWLGMLLFFGMATTHGYSMGKNILITASTLIGMMFIMFIIMLFTNLIQQMVSFITDIVTEVSLRG